MKHFLLEDGIDTTAYMNSFSKNPFVWLDRAMVSEVKKEVSLLAGQKELYAGRIMGTCSNYNYSSAKNREQVIGYLQDYEGVPYKMFNKRGTKSQSIDEKLRDRMFSQGYAKEFLIAFSDYKSTDNLATRTKRLYERMQYTEGEVTVSGNLAGRVYYQLEEKDNRRFSTAHYNVIGMNRDLHKSMCVPKGYFMVYGDLPQADIKVAYNLLLHTPENRHMFEDIEDSYEAINRMVYAGLQIPFNLDYFKTVRNELKEVSLGPIYGLQGGNTPKQDQYVKQVVSWLETIPMYEKFKRAVKARESANLPVVISSYFGYRQRIIPKTFGYGDNKEEKSLLNKALNAPMQTGTSELIILLVNSIIKEFTDLGYVEGEDFWLYLTRHDEPIFCMKEELLKECWRFKDYEEVRIDDWSPVKIDWFFSNYYKKPNPEYMKLYEELGEKNASRINHELRPLGKGGRDKYIPIRDLIQVSVGLEKIEETEETVVTILREIDEVKSQILCYKVPTIDDMEIYQDILNKTYSVESNFLDNNYDTVVINTRDFTSVHTEDTIDVIFKQDICYAITKAEIFSKYFAYKYCDKKNLDTSHFDTAIFEQSKELLQSKYELDLYKRK